ncbi:MAG: glycosyltransferase [Bacteroidia bacterium]|nr:glycosyltransferase [Bacteroidia bacterium]MCO5253192.1 glycosyltransferase [Bacteroidota bacterium]
MHKICTSLTDAGYSVLLVGRKLSHSKPLPSLPFEHQRLKCIFNKGFLFYLEYNIRLSFFLLFHPFDIVSSVDLDTISSCAIIAKIKRKKLVFDAHEYFTQVPEVIARKRVQKIWAWIEKTFVPMSDLCYTVGEKLAENFSSRLHCKFHVIKNVPELAPETLQAELSIPEKKFILYQGALNQSRGIENMILAMQQLDIAFHIVGEGDLSDTLRKLVIDNHLEDKVLFFGYMPPSDLREYSRKAYLGLNVSENKGLSYFYSLNNKFFDYVHALLPSLLNKFPEYEQLNSECEVGIYTESSVDNLVANIRSILDNNQFYLTLKSNCQKAAMLWNWENEKKKLIQLYDNL